MIDWIRSRNRISLIDVGPCPGLRRSIVHYRLGPLKKAFGYLVLSSEGTSQSLKSRNDIALTFYERQRDVEVTVINSVGVQF